MGDILSFERGRRPQRSKETLTSLGGMSLKERSSYEPSEEDILELHASIAPVIELAKFRKNSDKLPVFYKEDARLYEFKRKRKNR